MSLFLLPRRPARSIYDSVSEGSAAMVIRQYSSSFGLASRLLVEPVRTQVRNVYALVRIADEIVDNPDPGLDLESRARMLTWLHDDVRHALQTGYSGNLVVHAFARTANHCGIHQELIDPFFESMQHGPHDHRPHPRELRPLRLRLRGGRRADVPAGLPVGGETAGDYERLAPGAQRLGAAFQKLNFLRDLAEDHDTLRRSYFPGLDVALFCDADRDRILDDIAADLDAAAAVVPELPASSRRAVRAAHATFSELAARLRATPAAEIRRTRVRVPDPVKLKLLAIALYGGRS